MILMMIEGTSYSRYVALNNIKYTRRKCWYNATNGANTYKSFRIAYYL